MLCGQRISSMRDRTSIFVLNPCKHTLPQIYSFDCVCLTVLAQRIKYGFRHKRDKVARFSAVRRSQNWWIPIMCQFPRYVSQNTRMRISNISVDPEYYIKGTEINNCADIKDSADELTPEKSRRNRFRIAFRFVALECRTHIHPDMFFFVESWKRAMALRDHQKISLSRLLTEIFTSYAWARIL